MPRSPNASMPLTASEASRGLTFSYYSSDLSFRILCLSSDSFFRFFKFKGFASISRWKKKFRPLKNFSPPSDTQMAEMELIGVFFSSISIKKSTKASVSRMLVSFPLYLGLITTEIMKMLFSSLYLEYFFISSELISSSRHLL